MSSPKSEDLICPAGHGPQPADAIFCWACGKRLAPLGLARHDSIDPGVQDVSQTVPGAKTFQSTPALTRSVTPPLVSPAGLDPGSARPVTYAIPCAACGGDGSRLEATVDFCNHCRWLRPLVPGYKLDCSAFQWAQDGTAMQKLRSISALNTAARKVSDKVGRPWIEATFNAVHVSEKQLPRIHEQSILAARILNLSFLPDVYVSGERMWEAATYGSDTNSFIVLGSALVTSFPGDDLLFLLGREMGHCRAGHALWKTVIRFLLGEQGPKSNLMSGGLLSMFSLTTLVEGTLELPLLGWARQSEITADRAGLLAVLDESILRRVLLTWSLKSPVLFKQINIGEWMAQQEDTENQMSKLSELALSATPYVTRRLKLLSQFAHSAEMQRWRNTVGPLIEAARKRGVAQPSDKKLQLGKISIARKVDKDYVRMKCLACGTALRVPRAVLEGKNDLNVRCANAQCGKVVQLRRKAVQATTPVENAMQRETTTYAE